MPFQIAFSKKIYAIIIMFIVVFSVLVGIFVLNFLRQTKEYDLNVARQVFVSLKYQINGKVRIIDEQNKVEDINIMAGVGQSVGTYKGHIWCFFKSEDNRTIVPLTEIELNCVIKINNKEFYYVSMKDMYTLPRNNEAELLVFYLNKLFAGSQIGENITITLSQSGTIRAELKLFEGTSILNYNDAFEGDVDEFVFIVKANSSAITFTADRTFSDDTYTYYAFRLEENIVDITVSGTAGVYEVQFIVVNNVDLDEISASFVDSIRDDTTLNIYTPDILIWLRE